MIVTHQNPDLDAITGVWLLKKFGYMAEQDIRFVNTGNPDPQLLASASAVIDTGKVYDPKVFRFDHHHLSGNAANETCATKQVYEHLRTCRVTKPIDHLRSLIDIVFAGATGRPEANASRGLGLHAIFSGWKAWWSEQNPGERLSDQVALAYGFGLLDVLEVRLRKQAGAKAELAEKTVYLSDDGLVRAIKHGSSGSTFAAYEEGARLVLFEGEPIEVEGGTTYPVGIMRAGEWQEPHVGELVQEVMADLDNNDNGINAEFENWFCHSAGFFAGRGTAKAPVFEPVTIDLGQLAKIIDRSWKR